MFKPILYMASLSWHVLIARLLISTFQLHLVRLMAFGCRDSSCMSSRSDQEGMEKRPSARSPR